jgi:predicted Kef-type K+ transport protein
MISAVTITSDVSVEKPVRFFRWRWSLPIVASALAVVLTAMARANGIELRSKDPCVSGWENGWSISSSITLWLALGSAVVLVVLAVRGRRSVEAVWGSIAIGLIVLLSVVCWLSANGGYGWSCPEF